MTYAMIDLYCHSYDRPPAAVTFDIDDTCDVVHGNQQLSLFNAHYDERCFLPIHVYDAANARPVAVLLRPGKTPSGEEIRGHLRRMVRRIRRHWPHTRITIRGDCHYGRHEVMTWCEANGLHYIFGLSGNVVLDQMVEPLADAVRAQRAKRRRSWLHCVVPNHRLMQSGCAAPRRRPTRCAGTPKSDTVPSIGDASGASPRASRQRRKVSTSATS